MAQQPNPIELFEAAPSQAANVIGGINDSQLSASTPCADWNVEALLDHFLMGNNMAAASLSGSEAQEADKSGGRVEAYKASAAKLAEAAKQPGALEKTVQSPIGEMPGGQLLAAIFMDHLVHSWDLAKATGQDTALDPGLVEACYGIFVPMIDQMRGDAFGPAVSVSDDSSLQDKLIAFMGRNP